MTFLVKIVSLSVSIHFRVLMCSHDGNLRASVYRHLYCFSFFIFAAHDASVIYRVFSKSDQTHILAEN